MLKKFIEAAVAVAFIYVALLVVVLGAVTITLNALVR